MIVKTDQYGEIEYQEADIIRFLDGIPGFPDDKEYLLLLSEDQDFPFSTLQSIDTPSLSFVVTIPYLFYDKYDFELSESDRIKLGLASEEDLKHVLVFSMVTIPSEIEKTTINLMAPVIINNRPEHKVAKQVVLEEYDDVRYPIFNKSSEV